MKFNRILLAGAFFAYVAFHAAATGADTRISAERPNSPDATAGHEVQINLGQLGYRDGVLDREPDASYTFYFPIPRDVTFRSAVFHLHYRASPLLRPISTVNIFSNASPRAVLPLATLADPASKASATAESSGGATPILDKWATVTLLVTDLKAPLLTVKIEATTTVSDDICQDQRSRATFLEILPDSGVTYSTTDVSPVSIRAAWDLLPNHVKVAISAAPMAPDAFLAAWKVATRLMSAGHTIEIVRLPERADVVIARREELEKAFPLVAGQTVPDGNVILYPAPAGTFLAITDSFRTGLALLSHDWINLASEQSYDAMPEGQTPFTEPHIRLNLHALGFSDEARLTSGTTEWNIPVAPQSVPASYRPTTVSIQLVTAPSPAEHPSLLSTFWNGNLMEVERIPTDGRPHQFLVPLPKTGGHPFNQLRIRLERDEEHGRCGVGYGDMPVPSQLLGSTAIVCDRHPIRPATLSELSETLRSGYRVYLAAEEMEHPETVLAFLSRLTQDFGLLPDAAQITAFLPGQPIQQDRPFVVISARESSRGSRPGPILDAKSPVVFDRGRVLVSDGLGSTLLNVETLADLTVAQLSYAGGQPGLWIAPGRDGLPSAAEYDLSDGDVAFLANSGTVRLLDSRKVDISRVRYPDFRDWQQLLFEYRYWLFAVLWAMLTVAFVQLYRRTVGRQKAQRKTA